MHIQESKISSRSLSKWNIFSTLVFFTICLYFPRLDFTLAEMSTWADQSLYLRILSLADSGNITEALGFNYMGPSYIAAIQLIRGAFALDPSNSLILLGRLSVALAISLPVSAYCYSIPLSPNRFLACIGIFIVFLVSTPFLYSSSIPWSHYVFGLLGVLFLLFLDCGKGYTSFLCGLIFGVMATTRLYETAAIATLLIVYIIVFIMRERHTIDWRASLRTALYSIFGLLVGYTLHFIVLGEFHVYAQYSGELSHESYQGSPLNFRDVPVKLVQFFVDPCYYSICSHVDYNKVSTFVFSDVGLSIWRLPFLLQLPFYSAAVLTCALLLAWNPKLIMAILKDPVIFIGAGAALGLPVVYISYLVGGSDQLRYGFVRELFFPALCLLVIVLRLLTGSILKWGEKRFLFFGVALVSVLGLQIIPALHGFPRLTSTHIARVEPVKVCEEGDCSLRLSYVNTDGAVIGIPFDRYAHVQIECGAEAVDQHIVVLQDFRFSDVICTEGVKIRAVSTTTGVSRTVATSNAIGTLSLR